MIPRRFFWLIDCSAVAFAIVLAHALWPSLHVLSGSLPLPPLLKPVEGGGSLPPLQAMVRMFLAAAAAAVIVLDITDAYRPLLTQDRGRIVIVSLISAFGSAGAIALLIFFERETGWSRLFLFTFIALCATDLALTRLVLRRYFKSRRDAGFYTKNVLVVGQSEGVKRLVRYFRETVLPTEYAIIGYLTVPGDHDVTGLDAARLGDANDIGETLISTRVDEVIAVPGDHGAEWMPRVMESCDSLGILLRIVPQALLEGHFHTLQALYGSQALHLPAVVLAPPHFDSDAIFIKRVIDVAVSGVLLMLLSPVFLVIAALIKLFDRHSPVFYRWNVVGRNGARFTGYKFTTMYADADARRQTLLDHNEMSGPVFKIRNDPRVTPLGRFLRKFSLNELPQLWSVLKGDMSLVGPRPAFPHELEAYGFWHKRKLSVRPGITCLWQVRGRNRISNFDDWVKMDLEYIDHWSLWLDFKILVRTAWAVVAGTGS